MRHFFLKNLILALISLSFIFVNQKAGALSVNDTCNKVEILFARGSGAGFDNNESRRFNKQIKQRLGSPISVHSYELGSEVYGGYNYPAVAVGGDTTNHVMNSIGAKVSAGESNTYGESVNDGVHELRSYLSQRYEKCKTSGTFFILGGHSQGAQVVGQAMKDIPRNIRDRIVSVGLFGDPKLYLPEGEGDDNSPACHGKKLSLYRRIIAGCNISNGSLGGRKNSYLPDDMKPKTALWCYAHDYICGSSPFFWDTSGHGTYRNTNMAIDMTALEAVSRLKDALKAEQHSQTTPVSPPVSPAPNYDELVDTTYKLGMGQNGNDVVFVVDRSAAMAPLLPQVRDYITEKGAQIMASGGRYTIASYCAAEMNPGSYITAAGVLPFGLSSLNALLPIYTTACPYDFPTAPLYVLNATMKNLAWKSGAAKSIILFTNNQRPLSSPDQYGVTSEGVAKTALAIDPVNIYPVVPQDAANDYQQLADSTSGQVVSYTDDIVAAADSAYGKIISRPVPFLKNSDYIANPGEEISFDASDSYVVDSAITGYDWDFDGDGIFDTSTTTPTIDHTYLEKFDGTMQVRIKAANGTVANTSASVKISTYIVPLLPAAPTNLQVDMLSTDNNKSTVRLTWRPSADPLTIGWSLTVNGVSLGLIGSDQTSIEITDIDRSDDVDFAIAGVANNMAIGDPITVTLAQMQSPNQPDILHAVNDTSGTSTANDLLPRGKLVNELTVDDVSGTGMTNAQAKESGVWGSGALALKNTAYVTKDSVIKSSEAVLGSEWYWRVAILVVVAGGARQLHVSRAKRKR